ncbi:MAG: energy transducer TonB [Acidobacteriota bacterium]|nr:energy transducer TonB [Acidobacteriota bacterium]
MRVLRTLIAALACMGAVLAMQAQTASTTELRTTVPAQTGKPIPQITSEVISGLMLTKVPPIYPARARRKGIQGVVVLHAIIGRDGHIRTLEVVSGPEELRGATLDAVRQWTYKPYLMNGLPTEVDTKISINYTLDAKADAADAEAGTATEPDNVPSAETVKHIPRISSGMMQKMVLKKAPPVYPDSARERGIQGTVVLHAVIGKNGHVAKLEAISGPKELQDAAIDAVRRWTYRKYFLNGEPSEVETTVVVNFNLRR